MSFFDKLTNAGKDMAKKTKELADITKLNMQISSEEDNIKNKYKEIGKLYYELYSSNPDEKFLEFCTAITESMGKISDLRNQINEIKGVKKCSNCGAEIASAAVFCSACGNKAVSEESTTAESSEEGNKAEESTDNSEVVENCDANADSSQNIDSSSSLCPACNNPIAANEVFCSSCGTKLE